MRPTKQTIIALSTVAAGIILLASGPLVATHQVQGKVEMEMHFTTSTHHHHGNQNQQAISSFSVPSGGHNSAGCQGNPHGEVGTDTCKTSPKLF